MAKSHTGIKPIIEFFLDLFVLQTLGPGREADSAKAYQVSENPAKTTVYEFAVKGRGRTKHRRMSVQPIGGQVGSKSVCYKVIYDDLLVIKIPPNPITDFAEYLKYIHREHRIVNRLSPGISCIFPRLEAILKMVPFLKFSDERPPEETENAYINQLTRRPGLQQYLKIGGSFVFFMNLSDHMFFNQVIESMHSLRDRVRNDILKNLPGAFEDPSAFEALYGEENYPVYLELWNIFSQYEDKVKLLGENYGQELSVPEYRWKEWFFFFLAGLQPDIQTDAVSEEFRRDLNSHAGRVISENKQNVQQIYRTVHKRVKQKNFESNLARIKGVIVNVLDLLGQLKERNLALRDLKPDNMYIDRHLDAADHILANPEVYGFGLIDLETAVCFDPGQTPGQPLLAGTPAYATPSHLFANKHLENLYPGQLARTFYMQDWYAAVGIMFNVITGRLLFAKTARLMPEIMRAKKQGTKSIAETAALYKTISGRFWETAINEFREKTNIFAGRLSALEMELPGHLNELLRKEAKKEQKLIKTHIDFLLKKSPEMNRYRDKISNASHSSVAGIIKKYKSTRPAPAGQTNATTQILSLVARHKYRQEHLQHAGNRLSGPVRGDFLLSFVFDRAFYAMHRQEWFKKQPCPIGPCLEKYGIFQSSK
ncbi:MAG: hypothetical protein ACLFMN_06900 [Desulfobacterales bacterium]